MSLTRTLCRIALVPAFLAPLACRTSDSSDVQAGPNAVTQGPLYVNGIKSEATFAEVAQDSVGIIKGGKAVKFLIDVRKPNAPQVYFINLNYKENGVTPEFAKFHYLFAKKALNIPYGNEDFNRITYFSDTKDFFYAGNVQTYTLNGATFYGIQFYPQDKVKGPLALRGVKLVKDAITIPGAKFAFVETGGQQASPDIDGALGKDGIDRTTIEKILGSINYIPLNMGEAYGYLRIFPKDLDDLTATDIPVFNDLPLDLTVVAGTLTRSFQDTNSHINLKSKERGTPNAVLRDAGPSQKDLAPWADKPVHLVIREDGFTIEGTTDKIIQDKLAARFSKPWIPITWSSTRTLASYDDMCAKTGPAGCLAAGAYYGSKAANLGFLAHPQVLGRAKANVRSYARDVAKYDLVPFGFGVPLQFYADFVNYAPNKALKDKITEFIAKEKANALSGKDRSRYSAEIHELFYKGKFPPENLKAVKEMTAKTLPNIDKVKVRSSANAEDIDGFDGAGLHDSYSAKPAESDAADESCRRVEEDDGSGGGDTKAKMEPRTLACGIKGVYASLWNKRAMEERSFARIDHASVSMGVSVLPAYDYQSKVAANSVVVTRVINAPDVFGYTMSVQKKDNLVTNPDPGTWSESTVAALGEKLRDATLTVTRYAKPKKDEPALTAPILTRDDMLAMIDIVRQAEQAYCRAKRGYYPDDCAFVHLDVDKPKALDMEFKYLANGQFVCKQIREFGGR